MNVSGSREPELTERPDSLLLTTSTRCGIALLYNEESDDTYDVCLRLTDEALTVQKMDVVRTRGGESPVNLRAVVLRRRRADGGLGFSIKGGAEHNVPAVISKIFKDEAEDEEDADESSRRNGVVMAFSAHQTGKLFVGDAVLQVNGINVERCTHDEVVHLLRTAGEEVTITVRYLREVPSFLKLPLGCPRTSTDQHRVFDSSFHLNGNNTPPADEPAYEKRWLDTVCLPLLMARVCRSKVRSNCLQVVSMDTTSIILHFCSASESSDWLQAVSANISKLTLEKMKKTNTYNSPDDQIVHMGWVSEHCDGSAHISSFRFLALRGSYFYIFRRPPVSAADWERADTTHALYEVLFKVHQLGAAEDRGLCLEPPRSESLSFSILVGHGHGHTFQVELAADLATWEASFQRAVFSEVRRTQTKSYVCSSQGHVRCFTVDFTSGFSCTEGRSKTLLWRYKFSQLKGSSDDGKSRVKLLFQNADKQMDTRELDFTDLTAVLHCIHSFITAKVTSMLEETPAAKRTSADWTM